jgi:pyroglutamyl-peptidase
MKSLIMPRYAFLIVAVLFAARAIAAEPADNSAKRPELPVILLTGFEPFGPGKPANPSWEGIRQLDGQEWHGYRLAARELKVEWGVPLPTLTRFVEELHPVAIFSFGQGGGYAIETLAQNKRGAYPDNAGQQPAEPNIVPGGPAEYRATIDAKALARELESRDRRVRLSTEAGDYLCEEMLYSLEHLKASSKSPLTVAFCHVPPLQATAGPNQVTAATIQSFVEDVLAAWEATLPPPTVGAATPATARQAAADPREKEVRELIDRYFKSWSNQDLVRYGQCFMPQAAIQLIDPHRGLITMPLAPFLQSQQQAHQASPNQMTETPETIQIRFDAELAHALVYWKLVDGERLEYGYDHFTLMKSDGKWRIANIVFYAVKPPKDANAK